MRRLILLLALLTVLAPQSKPDPKGPFQPDRILASMNPQGKHSPELTPQHWLNGLLTPNTSEKKPQAFRKVSTPQGQLYVIDTLTSWRTTDTTREVNGFNEKAQRTSWTYQILRDGNWENAIHTTYSYDDQGNVDTAQAAQWTNGTWTASSRSVSTYDAHGNMLTNLYQVRPIDQWINVFRSTSTYDGQGKELSYLFEQWTNNEWISSYRYTTSYDASGKELSRLSEHWESGAWVNDARMSFTYNESGKGLSIQTERWVNGQWTISDRGSVVYDEQGHVQSYLYEIAVNGQLENSSHLMFATDASGNILTQVYSAWSQGQWADSLRESYSYNSSEEPLTHRTELWIGTQWENLSQSSWTYDAGGRVLAQLDELWASSRWENHARQTYQYSAEGNLIRYAGEVWQGSAWVPATTEANLTMWSYTDSVGNWYGSSGFYLLTLSYRSIAITGVATNGSNAPLQCSLAQNYPNPFNPTTTIRYELPKSSMVKLSVYDMLGREVSMLVNERKYAGVHEVKFDGSGLASGVYFYRMTAGTYVETKKLLLVR
jgi:hypothetical protein